MNMRRGLGRGLGALIPETSAFSHQEGELILYLPVESIRPNPQQPRSTFDEEDLESLTESIRDQGLLQPIVVRKIEDSHYQIIAGERRWRAAKRAGFEKIPAILRVTEDRELLPLALVENLVRQDLNPIEEAEAYESLSKNSGWTQEEIAERVGRGRVHIANTVRLLHLPPEIQTDVRSGLLSAAHARVLLSCEGLREMQGLRDQILSENLSVREAEDRAGVRRERAQSSGPRIRRKSGTRPQSPLLRDFEERLQRAFGTAVHIHERDGRGRISFEFFSSDDLTRLADLLLAVESLPMNAKSPASAMAEGYR
jgi:ParB family chromosome partitioning protein